MSTTERHVRIFPNGRNQAIRLPREFELEGDEAIIHKSAIAKVVQGRLPRRTAKPEANRFAADSDAALRQQVFDIAVAQVEAILEPNGAADDFRRE